VGGFPINSLTITVLHRYYYSASTAMPLSSQHQSIVLISVHGDPAIDIGREEAGGQNVYVRQVGEALARLGWKVDMLTRRVSSDQEDIVYHAEFCRTIRLTAGPQDFVQRDRLFEFLPFFLKEIIKWQAYAGVDYALIHSNYWLSSWVGMELSKLLGIPQVHTYHSVGAVKYETVTDIPTIANTRLETERRCLETVDRVVATSPQEQDQLRSLVSSYGNIDIIPCGTDVERFGQFSRALAREKLGIDPAAKVVFYIGRFDPRKGIETLVRAIALSRWRNQDNLQVFIGGGSRPGQSDGIERDRLVDLTQDLGLTDVIIFPGRISDIDLPLYYAAADVCVVPSHYEPFGLVAIESMASGTPVVASQVGGLQFTIVHEETGLLVPVKDEVAFAHAVDRILDNPDWRDRLGQAGRERVATYFSWDGVAQQLDQLYCTLLAEKMAVM
jgi:glycosyltransferase involved in cell wall biosynthesis